MSSSPTYTEEVVYPEVTVYQSAEQIPSFSNISHKAESRFDKLADKVAKGYEKKGMSSAKAHEIGDATAYDVGVRKYGKAGMERLAREGRRDRRDAESKFDKLSDKIAKQYRKKGMSAKKAKEIGNKTAYTIGARKYGKAGMARKARAGMRAESFGAENQDMMCCGEPMEFYEAVDGSPDYFYCPVCEVSIITKEFDAESFEAQGNPDKRTTTQYAKFYVGFEDDEGELRGGGKFKKYDDALAQADIVSEREGNSRIVTTRGFALWTDDGKGMWQEGYDKTVAKEFYSAEGYTIGGGFRLGFGLGLGMLALSTAITLLSIAVSKVDERQVE